MIDQAIGNALKELRAERDRLDAERQRVDAAITALESASGKAAPRKRGRPPKSKRASKKSTKATTKSGRARRGLLRETLHQILGSAKAPLTASVIRDKVAASGYPHSSAQNLYVSVFQTLANDPAVLKAGTGYSLGGRAAASSGSKNSKTKARKKAKPKKRKTSAKKAGRKAKKKTTTKAA